MNLADIEKENSSNEEYNCIEMDKETKSLKEKDPQNINKVYNLDKNEKRDNNKETLPTKKTIVFINILLLLLFVICLFFLLSKINNNINNISLKFNLRKNNSNKTINDNNSTSKETTDLNLNMPKVDLLDEKNITIIEDIKNLDIEPLGDFLNSKSNELLGQNQTKKKISLAFIYSSLYSNGIGRFITVTSKYLIKTGKYDICFITKEPNPIEFSYEPEIKRFVGYNNNTLIQNISKYHHIDIVVLQNVLSTQIVKFHHNLGQKVICIFHGVFMSSMYGNHVTYYKNWDQFDACDSFIFIASDDYYFYKNLGFKNEIFIPNLYTYDPHETPNSNLTNHNIVILGRLNDFIKGVKYAIKAMEYIIKEVPDAMLYLVSSDYRIQFLKNLTQDLNLTNNIIFRSNTYKLTDLFLNASVHM